jgi:DNA-binding NarL/FixJ family response regulator
MTPQRVAHYIQDLLDENDKLLKRNVALVNRVGERSSQLADVQERRLKDRDNRKKLSAREVRDIRQLKLSGMSQREIAYSYDINPATVSRIVRGHYHARVS